MPKEKSSGDSPKPKPGGTSGGKDGGSGAKLPVNPPAKPPTETPDETAIAPIVGKTYEVPIEREVSTSYLNYAMSVIVSRALPDVRDGLKPVHRRILYSMQQMGLRMASTYRKTGRIVGDVLGKYHPHGDQSIYDALVRLAQDFSMRYPMVDGQGNFGSVDGDPPAAMRYTEARLANIAETMLEDLSRETVDFAPNYDDSLKEPSVLPAALPYLLVNGAVGIAVGMATSMPPHNLREVAAAVSAYIKEPDVTIAQLMKWVEAPDFPTGGIIHGRKGIADAYHSGRGQIVVRARVEEEIKSGKPRLVVRELPYLVNKSLLLERMADLVRNRRLDGISDIRDESDRDGMRVVIELKKGAQPMVVTNQLYAFTQLQANFNVNALALVGGRPKLMNLKECIVCFVDHRREVVRRRTEYNLRRAEERAHIVEGLLIALDNIDEVIRVIRASKTVEMASTRLIDRFSLSVLQARAILEMRLQRLTSLEIDKLRGELDELHKTIAELRAILGDEQKVLHIIAEEITSIAKAHGDDRRTEIVAEEMRIMDEEELVAQEEMVVLLSHHGYTKRIASRQYRLQRRGGKGVISTNLQNGDYIRRILVGDTHDFLLFFTSEGKAHWLRLRELPEASRAARGAHAQALFSLADDCSIAAALTAKEFSDSMDCLLITRMGVVKRVSLAEFVNARRKGVVALRLDKGDAVISALLLRGDITDVLILTRKGLGLRTPIRTISRLGRATRGVKGIRLGPNDRVTGVVEVTRGRELLLVTEMGMGKRVKFSHFQPHGRGTKGQIAYRVTSRTGQVISALSVEKEDEVMFITANAHVVNSKVSQIALQTRSTQGIRVVDVEESNHVVDVAQTFERKDVSRET